MMQKHKIQYEDDEEKVRHRPAQNLVGDKTPGVERVTERIQESPAEKNAASIQSDSS